MFQAIECDFHLAPHLISDTIATLVLADVGKDNSELPTSLYLQKAAVMNLSSTRLRHLASKRTISGGALAFSFSVLLGSASAQTNNPILLPQHAPQAPRVVAVLGGMESPREFQVQVQSAPAGETTTTTSKEPLGQPIEVFVNIQDDNARENSAQIQRKPADSRPADSRVPATQHNPNSHPVPPVAYLPAVQPFPAPGYAPFAPPPPATQQIDQILSSPSVQRYMKLMEENIKLKAQLEIQEARQALAAELAELRLQQRQSRTESLERELVEIREASERAAHEFHEKHEHEADGRNREMAELQERFEAVRHELENRSRRHENEVQDLRRELTKATSEAEEQARQRSRVAAQVEELQAELERKNQLVRALEEKAMSLAKAAGQLKEKLAATEKKSAKEDDKDDEEDEDDDKEPATKSEKKRPSHKRKPTAG